MARNLVIRCDAGGSHGLGHLMRCLALAKAARDAAVAEPVFIVRDPGIAPERVRSAGFEVVVLPTGPREWDFLDEFVGRLGPATWLVIDDKYAEPEDVARFFGKVRLICYDDAPLREFKADIIVNTQPWTRREDYAPMAGRLILAGAAYNAVDPAYFDAALINDRRGILITMGGEDPRNDIAWVAEHFGDLVRPFPVDVVIGPAHPDPAGARGTVERWLPGARILAAPPSLAACARRAFLAISAGGTSCYELQAAGVAVAALAVEDHQVPFIRALEKLGGVVWLGGPQPRPSSSGREVLDRLLTDVAWQKERVASGRKLFGRPGGPVLIRAMAEHLAGLEAALGG